MEFGTSPRAQLNHNHNPYGCTSPQLCSAFSRSCFDISHVPVRIGRRLTLAPRCSPPPPILLRPPRRRSSSPPGGRRGNTAEFHGRLLLSGMCFARTTVARGRSHTIIGIKREGESLKIARRDTSRRVQETISGRLLEIPVASHDRRRHQMLSPTLAYDPASPPRNVEMSWVVETACQCEFIDHITCRINACPNAVTSISARSTAPAFGSLTP